jgi:hypothetical protein
MTKPPPFLLGAALLFWGWQSELVLPALLMALILESPRVIKARWDFADVDFTRIWTFCSLLLLAAAIYAFSASEAPSDLMNMFQHPSLFNQRRVTTTSSRAIASLIRWLPMIFFPFMAAEAFSSRQSIPLQTISLILQRRWKKARKLGRKLPPSPAVHVGYVYFSLCVFSASIHPSETTEFFWGFAALMGWALWPQRSRRFALPIWLTVFIAAVALGYAGQFGIRHVQSYIGALNPRWLMQSSRRGFDPFKNRTRLGQVGRLKESGQITLRLETREGGRAPSLLREASYRSYRAEAWYSGNSRLDFETIPHETNQTTYILVPGQSLTTRVTIACYLPGGQGLLPLPEGTARIDNLPAFVLSKNRCGAVLADGPGLVIFDASHGPGISFDSPPDEAIDRGGIPETEIPALTNVISRLSLEGQPLPQVMRVLSSWFATNFTYSTWVEPPSRWERRESPLTRFLLKTRQGHCEYFATATVLLLRQLGFDARYAVGYAVHENAGRNKYVVRQRDAHAWCLVWRDGLWRNFDTTPGSWVEHEARRASALQALSDLWSRLLYEFSRIRYGETHLRQYILWGLGVVLALLLYQIVFSRKRRRHHTRSSAGPTVPSWPGLDSEFYRLEQALVTRGLGRNRGEPLSAWLARTAADSVLVAQDLQALLALHYRYRFDPLGLTQTDRELLRIQVNNCLARLPSRPLQARSPRVW